MSTSSWEKPLDSGPTMLLSLTTTARPATRLAVVLGQDPDAVQSFASSFGQAHVFYPEAGEQRCTVALVVEASVRPYVVSSCMSLAIERAFGSALARGDATAIPIEAQLAVVPVADHGRLVRRLFEPLGYTLEIGLERGDSPYGTVSLRATVPLGTLLRHLIELLPMLDEDRHDAAGRDALASTEAALERTLGLADERHAAVHEVLRRVRARRVIDLGCGDGAFVRTLLGDRAFEQVVGADVSIAALERARERIRIDHLSRRQRARVELFHASLTYRDPRFEGFDAACVLEVIEHLEPTRLLAFERVLFEYARPDCVLVTTPNAEYNPRFEALARGAPRDRDHRFEWTRAQFEDWASAVAGWHGYDLALEGIGPADPELGSPTQMAVFTR